MDSWSDDRPPVEYEKTRFPKEEEAMEETKSKDHKIMVTLEAFHPAIARHTVGVDDGDFIGDDGKFIFVAEGTPDLYRVLHLFPKERVLSIEFNQKVEHASSVPVDEKDLPFVSINDVQEYIAWPHGAPLSDVHAANVHYRMDVNPRGWYSDADKVVARRRDGEQFIIKNRFGPVEATVG